MKDVAYLLVILVATASLAVVTGRAVVATLGLRRLARPSFETLSVAAFLGTGLWMLVGSWLFYAGVPARGAAIGVAIVVLTLVLVARWQGRWRLPDRTALPPALGVLLTTLMAGVMTLTPLMVGGSFNVFNDGYTYACHAEVLQHHGFVSLTAETRVPEITGGMEFYHQNGLRMGASFLLSLMRACVPTRLAVELLPVAVAWGLALNALGISLLCRWTFRLERPYAGAAIVVALGCINPLHFSTAANLSPQLYGTAYLMLLIAALSRAVTPGRRWWEWSALVGIGAASLASAYSELIPILALVGVGVLGIGGWANRRTPGAAAFWKTAGVAVLLALVVGNYEWLRVVRAITFQMGDVVGNRIEWTTWEFWRFGLGAQTYGGAFCWGTFIPPENTLGRATLKVAGVLTTVLFVVGLLRAVGERRGRVAVFATGVFLAMGLVFLVAVRDPWAGTRGHTWNLFKIGQWIYPLALAVQMAGLAWVARRVRVGPVLATHLAVLVVALSVPLHLSQARESASGLRNWLRADQPLVVFRDLHRQVARANPDQVLYLPESGALFPECWFHYVCYPIPVNDGRSGAYPAGSDRTLSLTHQPGTGTPWGFGFSKVDPTAPRLGSLENPNEVERTPAGEQFIWLGTRPASMDIWANEGGTAQLQFGADPGPSRPDSPVRTLMIEVGGGTAQPVVITGFTEVAAPVTLRSGVNKVRVWCVEAPTVTSLPGEKRHLMVRLEHIRVSSLPAISPAGHVRVSEPPR